MAYELTSSRLNRPSKDALRHRGKSALNRARKGEKIQSKLLYHEIEKMIQDGLHMDEIQFALQRSERYLRMVKADHGGTHKVIPKVKDAANLKPGDDGYEETRFTLEGFEKFFTRFSGKQFLPHHKPWVEAFIENRRVILNVPPRHAKSTIFSIWIPIWLICANRNIQIILISETKDLAQGWAGEIAGQLSLNDELIQCYGQFEPDNRGDTAWRPNQGELVVRGRTKHAKGAQFTVQSRGMEQKILGMECDYVIADDPTSYETADSEVARTRALKHFQMSVLSRIEPEINFDAKGNKIESQGGRAIVIGQRVHLKDLYGALAKQKREYGSVAGDNSWRLVSYPAIKNWKQRSEEGWVPEVLWPERWPYEELMLSYDDVGGLHGFECMYQQHPMAEGTALIDPEWLESCKDYNRNGYEGIKRADLNDTVRVCSIDPSPTMYNAMVIADVICSREKFYSSIIEVDHFKGNLYDLVSNIQRAWKQHKFDYFIFEESGFATWFWEDPLFLSFKENFKPIKHKTNVNKNNREFGVQSLAGDIEGNRISFPYGDADGRRMTDLFASEALEYPEGETDDILMALWFIKFNYKALKRIDRDPAPTSGGQPYSFVKALLRKQDPELERMKAYRKAKAGV